MRSVWSGKIAFGNGIPVRLYRATDDARPVFKRIHAKDRGAVKRIEVCSECGQQLANNDVIRGYEIDGEMIPFSPEEIESLKPEKGEMMKILYFTERDEVPTIAISDAYFVGTADEKTGGFGAFATFRDALIKSGKVAVVQWTSRGYCALGILEPYGDGFVIKSLRYANEIRSIEDIEITKAEPNKKLVKPIIDIIDRMTQKFDHGAIRDETTELIHEYIAKKASGEIEVGEIVVKPTIETEWEESILAMVAPKKKR